MTTNECKKIVKSFLDERKLAYGKLTARTIDFTDLMREQVVFVTVHGWEASPRADDLERLARDNGFRVDFAGFPS